MMPFARRHYVCAVCVMQVMVSFVAVAHHGVCNIETYFDSLSHIILLIITMVNKINAEDFWVKEQVLSGIEVEGPVVSTLLNFTAGMLALWGTNSMAFCISSGLE